VLSVFSVEIIFVNSSRKRHVPLPDQITGILSFLFKM